MILLPPDFGLTYIVFGLFILALIGACICDIHKKMARQPVPRPRKRVEAICRITTYDDGAKCRILSTKEGPSYIYTSRIFPEERVREILEEDADLLTGEIYFFLKRDLSFYDKGYMDISVDEDDPFRYVYYRKAGNILWYDGKKLERMLAEGEKYTIRFKVKGLWYRRAEEKSAAYRLEMGDLLVLKEEPDNVYDPFAIKVMTEDGFHIGYVEASKAKRICTNMGDLIECRVDRIEEYDGLDIYAAALFKK